MCAERCERTPRQGLQGCQSRKGLGGHPSNKLAPWLKEKPAPWFLLRKSLEL